MQRLPGAATGRRVFIEYLLLEGVNDSDADAVRLARLLGARGGFHVNLIAYNPTAAGYRGPAPAGSRPSRARCGGGDWT